ncbi:MAG TPA: hypothetical protein VER33_14985 [Polyangiaceae bacterium]|nr:hypothetical protein [Polyangiaceae bacterium]
MAPAQAPTHARPSPDQARGYAVRPGTEPEDVVLFVPRLVLAVPRYAIKAVFFPVTQLIAYLDREAVVERVVDVLYNDERTAAIVPKLSVATFFGPTLGIKAFHDDLAGHGEQGSVDVVFGGRFEQAYQLAFRAARFGGTHLWVESMTRFEIEPSLLFQGIGDAASRAAGMGLDPREAAVVSRFRQQRLLSLWRVGYTLGFPGPRTQIGVTGIYNQREFGRADRGSSASTDAVYDTRRLVGFDAGVSTLETDVNLVVDTRDRAGATSQGVYMEAFGGAVLPFADYHYWHHGLELTTYIDLYRASRVLVLRALVEGVEGAAEHIPFSDLPRLGGPYRLRGYPLDRFRDEKAAVGTIEYHYPIHQYVAGSLYFDVGQVAASYTDLFEREWKRGFGGGFIVRSQDRVLFTFDVAYGEALQFYFTTDPLRAFTGRDTEL